jgi:hypothetical protein
MSDLREDLEQNRPAIEAGLLDAEQELADLDARRAELVGLICPARAALGELPSAAIKPAAERLTLHEAMALVLRENENEWMTVREPDPRAREQVSAAVREGRSPAATGGVTACRTRSPRG